MAPLARWRPPKGIHKAVWRRKRIDDDDDDDDEPLAMTVLPTGVSLPPASSRLRTASS